MIGGKKPSFSQKPKVLTTMENMHLTPHVNPQEMTIGNYNPAVLKKNSGLA
jgi:hypothetical protein